ncbi:MAG: hypothetical protein CL779_02240 [Chloroflexi bacterium]|nr:hypothetical protein [Chloroflexota bacterium]|tara:strand:+ start:2420 stop:3175 length:756 start_codon:yes stop_codon:yes gene_type:complete
MQKYFSIKNPLSVFILALLIIFSIRPSLSAQAPMTVFGVVPSATATVKIFVDATFCKDANILVEPNSTTGYIFLGYIDEGECNAFADSLISFNLNGQNSQETILWRKGGAPQSSTGLVLTAGTSQNSVTEQKNTKNDDNAAEKKNLPVLPGPAEKPKEESETKDSTATKLEKPTQVDNQDKKNTSEDKEKIVSTTTEEKKQPITKNTSKAQLEEKQTVVKSEEDDSGRNTIIFAGLATILVLLGFYSLARR